MAYVYRVVPFTASVKSADKAAAATAAAQLETIVNANAKDGWEFVTVNDVSVGIAPSCLGALFGGRATYLRLDQIVFRREG